MGVVNSKMGVTAIFSRAFRAHSVLCLPTQKFLRAPLPPFVILDAQSLNRENHQFHLENRQFHLENHPAIQQILNAVNAQEHTMKTSTKAQE